MSRRAATVARPVAAALLVASGLAACGSGAGGTGGVASSSTTLATATGTTTGSVTSLATTHPRSPVVRGPRVGVRQGVHIAGTYLTVAIERVVALPDTGSRLLPGTRAVGVELQLANQSGPTYDSTSSGDVSLVLAHGLATPLDVRQGLCKTPLVDFESVVVSGDVRIGCVAFSVPRGARVIGVRFSPYSRTRGTLTWRVAGG